MSVSMMNDDPDVPSGAPVVLVGCGASVVPSVAGALVLVWPSESPVGSPVGLPVGSWL
jgi:hypothetical protein